VKKALKEKTTKGMGVMGSHSVGQGWLLLIYFDIFYTRRWLCG